MQVNQFAAHAVLQAHFSFKVKTQAPLFSRVLNLYHKSLSLSLSILFTFAHIPLKAYQFCPTNRHFGPSVT